VQESACRCAAATRRLGIPFSHTRQRRRPANTKCARVRTVLLCLLTLCYFGHCSSFPWVKLHPEMALVTTVHVRARVVKHLLVPRSSFARLVQGARSGAEVEA
jgi:hypothetical protein